MDAPTTAAELGLMQGYPPPLERRVSIATAFSAPHNRWAFQHMRDLFPTAEVYRGSGPVVAFEPAPSNLDSVPIPTDAGGTLPFAGLLDRYFTDACVVLHHGRLVYERYANGMSSASQHLMMSVTKSLVGTLALQLAHEGLIDLAAPVSHYVPELAASAWGDATVRHALDMTTGIDFAEIYDDQTSGMGDYSVATGLFPTPPDDTRPRNLADYFPTLRKAGEHGERFHYVTPNTDAVGWVIARVSGKSFSRLFSERLWSRLGVERDAYILKDVIGMELTGGGFNATARDVARFGQLILDDGVANGEQLLDPAVIADILAGGDRTVFARGLESQPEAAAVFAGCSYHSFWWHAHNPHGAVIGIGINGQWLYLDPTVRMVAVVQSSHPRADYPLVDGGVLAGLHAIAKHLHSG